MTRRGGRAGGWLLAAGLMAALAGASVVAAAAVTRELAVACARKIEQIGKAPAPGHSRRTVLTEGEVNSWLAYSGAERLPAGVTDPAVTLLGENRVAGQAVVDLELMGRRRGDGSALDPWSLLTGRVTVAATGRLKTEEGVGRFQLESARVAGIPVPKRLLQELVSFYGKSPSRPQGVSLDEAFPLPARIESLEVGAGQAVVVQ